MKSIRLFCFALLMLAAAAINANQTSTLSPVFPGSELDFDVRIETADFSLPNGLHSYALGIYEGKWLLLAGRTNGLHGFNDDDDNFPPQKQNTVVYVVDPKAKTVYSRSLEDASSGLSQAQIDTLSVTSPQSYQKESTLYMTGGYGVDTANSTFGTKDVLTAINMPGLISWVVDQEPGKTAAENIRQISNPIFQVTGGYMYSGEDSITLLIFGQNFKGYYLDSSNGLYTQQVRRFRILDDGENLGVIIKTSKPEHPNPNYRRRDLNVVPIIADVLHTPTPMYVAFSGVFTLDTGVWTVPVVITRTGSSFMEDADSPKAFKQAMNHYVCPTIGLYSHHSGNMYNLFLGGISYGYFENGTFQTDSEIPFINQVTTVRISKHGIFTQYLMEGTYPTILSTSSNPGNPLLFGAGADFVPVDGLPAYKNGVFKKDDLGRHPVLLGYVVGGIQSTLPNTNTISDSAASPYIFKVTLVPRE